MEALITFAKTILTGLLLVSNTFAYGIADWLAVDTSLVSNTIYTSTNSGPAPLPGWTNAVPNILRQSLPYQQAALATRPAAAAPAVAPIDAIVNIFCTFTSSERTRTITGTGFFVSTSGVIMTNAHVAQFLLLAEGAADQSASCVVRTGNPAAPTYTADLLYLPPLWIQENATVFREAEPVGTGERDYALLYVTDTVTGAPLPATFPALATDESWLWTSARGQSIVAAGYPAGALIAGGRGVDLVPTATDTRIVELYTFGSRRADVFSVAGSSVGAQGSSGGPVVNEAGDVIGVIVTRGDDAVDGVGSLRAITLGHINSTIEQETGFPLSVHTGDNLAARSQIFKTTMTPFLLTLLSES
jgi:S1-C subfamily serine protease